MATSGASDLLRGWPCWSTTVRRTVRSPRSRIRLATALAAAACSGVYRPCRSTNPAWPTPVTPDRSGVGLPIIWLASDQAVPCAPRGPCQSCSLPGPAGPGDDPRTPAGPRPRSFLTGPCLCWPGGRPPDPRWAKAPFLPHGALPLLARGTTPGPPLGQGPVPSSRGLAFAGPGDDPRTPAGPRPRSFLTGPCLCWPGGRPPDPRWAKAPFLPHGALPLLARGGKPPRDPPVLARAASRPGTPPVLARGGDPPEPPVGPTPRSFVTGSLALRWLMISSMATVKFSGSTSASERNVSVRCTPLIWKILVSRSSRRCA